MLSSDWAARPSHSMLGRAPFLQARFAARTPVRLFLRPARGRLGREIPPHDVPRQPPFGEWRYLRRRFYSTSDSIAARSCLREQEALRPSLVAFCSQRCACRSSASAMRNRIPLRFSSSSRWARSRYVCAVSISARQLRLTTSIVSSGRDACGSCRSLSPPDEFSLFIILNQLESQRRRFAVRPSASAAAQ